MLLDFTASLYDFAHPGDSLAEQMMQDIAGQNQTGADIVTSITKDCSSFGTCGNGPGGGDGGGGANDFGEDEAATDSGSSGSTGTAHGGGTDELEE